MEKPRFSPDNSEEAKARRKAHYSWGGARIEEQPSARVRPAQAYDHALAWVAPTAMGKVVDLNANVLKLFPDDDDDDLAA